MDEILWCYHSNETSLAVLSHGTFLGRSSNFWFCAWNPMVLPFKWNLSCSTFTWYYLFSVKFQLLIPYIALTFSVDELLWCDHSNETFLAVVSHDTIYLLCSTSFWVCGWHPVVWPFKWNHFDRTFTCYMYVIFFLPFPNWKFGNLNLAEFWLWPLLGVKGLIRETL